MARVLEGLAGQRLQSSMTWQLSPKLDNMTTHTPSVRLLAPHLPLSREYRISLGLED